MGRSASATRLEEELGCVQQTAATLEGEFSSVPLTYRGRAEASVPLQFYFLCFHGDCYWVILNQN